MIAPIIQSLFPTAVTFANIDRPFTKQEQEFVKATSKKTTFNRGNRSSLDNYILEQPVLATMKDELLQAIEHYMRTVLCVVPDTQIYITQSWINYTKLGQFHHKHTHANSFLSAIIYLDASEVSDKIFFYEDAYRMMQLKMVENAFNLWNSTSWSFPVKTGDVVVFPSSLAHMVETKAGTNLRTSLSCNTFFRGIIGSNKPLTELVL